MRNVVRAKPAPPFCRLSTHSARGACGEHECAQPRSHRKWWLDGGGDRRREAHLGFVLEAGVHRGRQDVVRYPVSFRFSMRRGLEFGLRTSDVSVLWEGHSPSWVFKGALRYRMAQSGD